MSLDLQAILSRQPADQFLTVKQITALTGWGDDKIRALRASGKLPARNTSGGKRTGARWLFNRVDLDKLLQQMEM